MKKKHLKALIVEAEEKAARYSAHITDLEKELEKANLEISKLQKEKFQIGHAIHEAARVYDENNEI